MARDLDLQRIRKDYKVTQQRLAELTKYPQSFLSQIENARVPTPEAFVTAVQKVLGIDDIEPYFVPTAEERAAQEATNVAEDRMAEQQNLINRLLDMVDRRDERVRELELEVKELHAFIFDHIKKE